MKVSILFLSVTFLQVRAIFEIRATPDTRKCYKCTEAENCKIPWLQECSIDDHCFSKTVTTDNVTVETKGCIGIDSVETLCQGDPEEVECYTCKSNFCNVKDTEFDRGVKQCYQCIDECDKPPAVQNCEEVLSVQEKKIVKAACLRYQIKKDDEITLYKGCMLDVSAVKSACTLSSLTNSEISCSYCTKELCNYEKDETPVDQCYHCVDDCTTLEIQNCKEVLGASTISRCAAAEYEKEDGTQVEIRGCVKENDDFLSTCNTINENGGNCTVCTTNLCNDFLSVTECYHCDGNCNTLNTQNCLELFGENAKTRCISTEVNGDESRKCILLSHEEEETCNKINEDGGSCDICDSELCNVKEKDPDSVDECYFCEGKCESPLQKQRCKEDLGEYASTRCAILETVSGSETLVLAKCIDSKDSDFITACNTAIANGRNCTICSTNLCNDIVGPKEEEEEEEEKDDDGNNSSPEKITLVFYFLIVSIIFVKAL